MVRKKVKTALNPVLGQRQKHYEAVNETLARLPGLLDCTLQKYFEKVQVTPTQYKALSRFGALSVREFLARQFDKPSLVVDRVSIREAYEMLLQTSQSIPYDPREDELVWDLELLWHIFKLKRVS